MSEYRVMRDRSLLFFMAFTLIGTLVLMSLGAWQWQRRGEKRAFIAQIAAAATKSARPLAEGGLWERVSVTGRYLPEKTAFIRTSRPAPKPGERDRFGRVPVSGFGVQVISAFNTEFCAAGSCRPVVILVNRGFLPTPPSGAIPPIETPSGLVTLTGFLRPGEREGLFPPHNDPGKGTFFFRSTQDIARHLGLSPQGEHPALAFAASFDREADGAESQPPFGMDVPDLLKSIPDNHLEYAITWWSLALTNLAVAFAFLFGQRRRRDENAVTDAN
ncbi:MAG: SURF1 family protein [Methylobacterium sp.]|nr:SURF1 family protein [Methylobacterium sp.]